MQKGPQELFKLPFENTTYLIHSHEALPFLLSASTSCIYNYNISHSKITNQIPLNSQVSQLSHLAYSNKSIIYTVNNLLVVNEKKIKLHNCPIKHFISDNSGLILTASEHKYDRCIKIVSVSQDKLPIISSQFSFHYQPVTALFWKNSLGISGDASGQICLWDVNKCRTLSNRKAHYQAISHIGTYVDYLQNNLFYTVCSSQKRLIFSDLRKNSPIKIISNLSSQNIVSVKSTGSGKVLIIYSDFIDVVDLYQQYKLIGNFSPHVIKKQKHMQWTKSNYFTNDIRKICCGEVAGTFLIVGCDNGNIQVYDTDKLQCLYAFGLGKYGPIKSLEINHSNKSIFGVDGEGGVYMAKFIQQ